MRPLILALLVLGCGTERTRSHRQVGNTPPAPTVYDECRACIDGELVDCAHEVVPLHGEDWCVDGLGEGELCVYGPDCASYLTECHVCVWPDWTPIPCGFAYGRQLSLHRSGTAFCGRYGRCWWPSECEYSSDCSYECEEYGAQRSP